MMVPDFSPAPKNPIVKHAPPTRSPPPPQPLPEGYHKLQSCRGLDASTSRPLSPLQQFELVRVTENWMDEVEGEPSEDDIKVLALNYC